MKPLITTLLFLFIANFVGAQCAPSITTQPVNTSLCSGSNTSFSLSATGTSLTYQWLVYNGTAFAAISNGGVYSGATTSTLTITGATAAMNGYQYECVVSGSCNPVVTSNIVTLTVNSSPTINTQLVNDSVCSGSSATFSLSATGTSLTYQWFSNSVPLTNGPVYSGVTSSTLSISSATTAMSGNTYYCVVSGLCSPAATSNVVTLVVVSLPATPTASATSPICTGGTLVLTAACTTSGAHYGWSCSGCSSPFSPPDADTVTYPNVNALYTGSWVVYTYVNAGSLTCNSASTASAGVVVDALPNNPTTSIDATHNITVCQGSSLFIAALTVPSPAPLGIPNFICLGPSGPILGGNVNISSSALADSGRYIVFTYFSNYPGQGTFTCYCGHPDTVYAHVNALPPNPQTATVNSLCTGDTIHFHAANTPALCSSCYAWTDSTSSPPFPTPAYGSDIFIPNANINDTGFVQVHSLSYLNGVSCSSSGYLSVHIGLSSRPQNPTVNSNISNNTICLGDTLHLHATDSGTGLSYFWMANNPDSNNINTPTSSITVADLIINSSQLIDSGTYKVWAVQNGCKSASPASIGIGIGGGYYPFAAPHNDTVCIGDTARFHAIQISAATYQWDEEVGNTFVPLAGGSGSTLVIPNVMAWMNLNRYRCTMLYQCSYYSDTCTLIVDTPISITTPAHNDTICNGGNSGFRIHATGTGLTYQWQADTSTGFYNLSNAGVYSGVSSDSLTITSANNMDSFRYRCIITGTCSSTTSDTAVLRVLQTPAISTIGNSLCGGTYPFGSFQWYANNTVIAGAVNQCFTPSASLCYSYIITASANATCQSSPDCYVYCPANIAQFTEAVSGLSASFSSTTMPPAAWQTITYSWDFGDAATDTAANPSHAYSASNTYNVRLIANWIDTATTTVQCSDTTNNAVIVGNIISGNIYIDTTSPNPSAPAFKIWLITYDTVSNTLTAVDSTVDTGANFMAYYQFINEPAGDYLVKAMITNGPTSGIGPVPTYGLDSLHWSGAVHIPYTGSGSAASNNIYMLQDSVTSGPGFIAGNVTSGANKGTKGTGAPVDSMLILLENVNSHFIKHTYTDASGNYSFSNLGYGTYIVYPEEMNYATAPWTGITLSNGNATVNSVAFTEHTISKTITPANTSVKILAAENEVHIYPNPAKGSVNILLKQMPAKNTQTIITDLVGHKLLENPTTSLHSILDLSGLTPGVYFISIKGDNINHIQKIILQR